MRYTTLWISLYLLNPATAVAEEDDWQDHLERIERSVVVLQVDRTRTFDGDISSSTQATGFVVNAEQGLILTNRHVVSSGPVTAVAIFANNEAVNLEAVYRDPVHDFGFFRFDPASLISIEPENLELVPDGAQVGMEIRVIGNDAGEKLSIMHGTLARLDRPAPAYGAAYNDFNTHYYQAGSSTSGGSSGSPVIDMDGRVVALNAGSGRDVAASFYLPLHRVERALSLIENGLEVQRGTLQTVWSSVPYDELRALGLNASYEVEMRERWPDQRGLLVVDEILPFGPADDVLALGDILLEVNGEPVADFIDLEAIIDEHVHTQIDLTVLRSGSTTEVRLWVDDLHEITPSSFFEFGGAVLHDLSYHQARNQGVRTEGIYLARPGFVFENAGIPRHAVIIEANEEFVYEVADLERIIAALPNDAPLSLRYFTRSNPRQVTEGLIRINRLWFPTSVCQRNDPNWTCTESAAPTDEYQPTNVAASPVAQNTRWARRLSHSLVTVDFDIPYKVAGVNSSSYRGTGLVVDAERGLVVVDRDTVPVVLGDVEITIHGVVQIPGQVVGLHPSHNLALVSYEPTHAAGLELQSAELDERPLTVGETVYTVGLQYDHHLVQNRTTVEDFIPILLPTNRAPRFRESNLLAIDVADAPDTIGGVLTDRRGRVRAFYASFSYNTADSELSGSAGMPSRLIRETLEQATGDAPPLRTIGVEFTPINLADAVQRGLTPERVREITTERDGERQLLRILRVETGHPAHSFLRAGDILLQIGDQLITNTDQMEANIVNDSHEITILRSGRELVQVVPSGVARPEVDRFLFWGGAYLHAPHTAARILNSMPPTGVYVSRTWYGSPASRSELYAVSRIVAVDDIETPDLDAFITATENAPNREGIMLSIVDSHGREEFVALRPDYSWWPTMEFRWVDGEWIRRELPTPEIVD